MSHRSGQHSRVSAWLIGGLVIGTLALLPASYGPLRGRIVAQDLRDLKPLPKFLRSAVIADRYLGTRDIEEVMGFERVEAVCLQLVKRPNVPRHVRVEALMKLAELRDHDPLTELLPWIRHWDQELTPAKDATTGGTAAGPGTGTDNGKPAGRGTVLEDLSSLAPEQTQEALAAHRAELEQLAREGIHAVVREAALMSLIGADQDVAPAWTLTHDQPSLLLDFVQGLRWLPPDARRADVDQRLRPLLQEAPSVEIREAAIAMIGQLGTQPRETFETLADFVAEDVLPQACVASICNISKEFWTPDRRQPLAAGLLRYIRATPLAERTSPEIKQSLKLVRTLADVMPSDQAAPLLRDLEAVTVREIRIQTLEEQMAYDVTVLIVQAGQGVQIQFHNEDIMPHNLVIVDSPDAREEVGIAADQMQNQPDALAKGYLPPSDHILYATRLLYPQQHETLTFEAPQSPGTYAYLCTFPGHWSKMYGALVVVDDVAAYRAANTPLPRADDLLGIKTVEWTYDQLLAKLPDLNHQRSFENGQKNFLKASCFSCHQVRQQGGRIGPELTGISEKYKTAAEILRHIMTPSEKVEPNYATVIVETSSGQIIRGVLIGESETELTINENPLASCEPQRIPKDEVDQLTRSKLSPMPEKLLNTLIDTNDVLDLLAYLIAGGNPDHELYQ